jgi:hypothetical protein
MAYKLGPRALGVDGTFPLLTITSKLPGPAFAASTEIINRFHSLLCVRTTTIISYL